MSLITTSSNGQNPSQYTAKFPSGSVEIPRNGQIAFYNGSINYNKIYTVNNSNDTIAIFCGVAGGYLEIYNNQGLPTNSDKQWEFIDPQLIKIPHGTYQTKQTANQLGASVANNKENDTGDFAAALCTVLNTEIIFRSWKFVPTYDTSGLISIKGYSVVLDGSTTDLILLDRYGLNDNSGSTIVQNQANPGVPATFMSVAGSTLAVSRHSMMFPANLNNVGNNGSPTVEYICQFDINIPGGQNISGWVGSFFGLAKQSAIDLQNPSELQRAVREQNGDVYAQKMPVFLRIIDDGQGPQIEAVVRVFNEDGSILRETIFSAGPPSNLTASNAGPTGIGIAASANTNGKYRIQFYILNPGGPPTKTLLTNGADNFYEIDSSEASDWFTQGEQYKLIVNRTQTVNTQSLTISGRDDHIGRGSADANLPLVTKGGLPNGACTVMMVSSLLSTNQIIDGRADAIGGTDFSLNTTDKAVQFSQVCNATFLDNKIINANRTGGSNYICILGADSNNDNGKWVVGALQPESKDFCIKVNLDNLQLRSVHGDLLNGNLNNTLFISSFKMDSDLGTNSQALTAEPQLIYIDCNNREPLALDRLEISLRDEENQIYQNLIGNTFMNFLIREKQYNILREKRSDILRVDDTEKNIKLSNLS